ncbi:dihydrofolate reductase family protein [Microbacterium sp. 2MCAF23]|uniref:dihydrofolate reductase family protein n=1 Tax=Microbacterium sp. 2MCAF23 TaxID=3232985 RepID=UPI003F9BDDB4
MTVSERKLILSYYVSVDGKSVGAENGMRGVMESIDDDVQENEYVRQLWEAGAFLMGRASYDAMKGFWPVVEHPSAAPMNAIPKVVFSRTPVSVEEWGEASIAAGDLAGEIARLKSEPGKDLFAIAGDTFQRALIAADLVDEYRLWVLPAAAGTGTALFPEQSAPLRLRLVQSTPYPSGIVELRYARQP